MLSLLNNLEKNTTQNPIENNTEIKIDTTNPQIHDWSLF
jgi:ABC-type lipoprotein release transport system permease subunit